MKNSRENIRIEISETPYRKRNYVFEAYRLAVKFNITGYVKRLDEQMIEIIISGYADHITPYITQFKTLCHNDVSLEINKDNSNIIYKEFRILKT